MQNQTNFLAGGNSTSPKACPRMEFGRLPDKSKNYLKIDEIGSGSGGLVHRAMALDSGTTVAIKKVRIEPQTKEICMREAEIMLFLRPFKHPHVVELLDVYRSTLSDEDEASGFLHLVMPCYPIVLSRYIKNRKVFYLQKVRCLARQVLSAVDFMHSVGIYHRDVKPLNIFLTPEGRLKIGDFGLSDFFEKGPNGRYGTSERLAVTLWYRPPEILFGESSYGPEVDMWSVGCTLTELFTGQPLLKGSNDFDQLRLISHLCGDLVPEVWPGVDQLPWYSDHSAGLSLYNFGRRNVKDGMLELTRCSLAADLITKLLTPNPKDRISAEEALRHDFLKNESIEPRSAFHPSETSV